MTQRFVQGVNYWPRRKAMAWWSDFDAGEVRDEFAQIADLGLEVVRIFLLWDDWQPEPDRVPTRRLHELEATLDAAHDVGLRLNVTFFVGHMSGPNWLPRWLLDDAAPLPSPRPRVSAGRPVTASYRNPFHDPVALDAEATLLRTVAGAFAQHEGVDAWNLGNEPDLLARPRDAAAGRAWTRRMVEVVREVDPHHPVTLGLHADSLLGEVGLRPHDVFAETDRAVMHAYPMYLAMARGPLDPELVPFTNALTRALTGGTPIWMEEWGGCTAAPGEPSHVATFPGPDGPYTQFMASEADLAAYVEAVLAKLVEVGAPGSLLWNYADYDPALGDRPPLDTTGHERTFGLVRADGTPKPHAEVVRRVAADPPVVPDAPPRVVELDVTPEAYHEAPARHAARLYRRYLERYEPGGLEATFAGGDA